MRTSTLGVLGIGSLRSGPAIVASLAGYFGESQLRVRFWDADAERLDLFERLATTCFDAERAPHELEALAEPEEAVEGADFVLLAHTENCARRFLVARGSKDFAWPLRTLPPGDPRLEEDDRAPTKDRTSTMRAATRRLIACCGETVPVLCLAREPGLEARPMTVALGWPEDVTADERRVAPHRILRWIRGDEPVHALLSRYATSPIKRWLESPVATARSLLE